MDVFLKLIEVVLFLLYMIAITPPFNVIALLLFTVFCVPAKRDIRWFKD